jgi:Ca2+-binding RTX toxin-like protein
MKTSNPATALVTLLLTTAGLTFAAGTPAHASDVCPAPAAGTIIWGTPDDDVLVGSSGDDWIAGLEGNDRILGAGGSDIILGGGGHDAIGGGDGCDVIYGGAGNDVINGGDGTDTADGGTGLNICEVENPQIYQAVQYATGILFCGDYAPLV